MRCVLTGLLCLTLLSGCSTLVLSTGESIIFSGRITPESAEKFRRKLEAAPQAKRLLITSPGGDAAAGMAIGRLVFERRLDVEVKRYCMSACANYVFTAGRIKHLAPGAVVAWHRSVASVVYGLETAGAALDAGLPEEWGLHGQSIERVSEQLAEATQALLKEETEFFAHIGVNGFVCWVGRLGPEAVEDFYTLSVADMGKFGIRRVQAAADYGSGDLSHASQDKIRLFRVEGEPQPPLVENPRPPSDWFRPRRIP